MGKIQRSKGRGKGSQLDALKRIRKEMPKPTRVIKPKTKRASNNWRDLLEDDDFDDFDDFDEEDV